ncbi:DUF7130 family rubredoxin-like protein [Haloarcula nitratireducens]|uniref:DUF7130 domain-containing protein n=1 Tax=Haloarcula nitratireducens TaxID=2487749 RepID=A0AAW4PK68_9EURY|nr:hypothetical protein [Halomicroarcula nitratireducens]MBX0297948.1 hypothetical protein [Halomicroarcula nitratireducens]
MSEDSTSEASTSIEAGLMVYDLDGSELGVITGMTNRGFEVSMQAEIEDVDEDGYATLASPAEEREQAVTTNEESLHKSEQENNPGGEFGEGYIMWRCENCGEMGDLDDGLPTECPACGSDAVHKQRED